MAGTPGLELQAEPRPAVLGEVVDLTVLRTCPGTGAARRCRGPSPRPSTALVDVEADRRRDGVVLRQQDRAFARTPPGRANA